MQLNTKTQVHSPVLQLQFLKSASLSPWILGVLGFFLYSVRGSVCALDELLT